MKDRTVLSRVLRRLTGSVHLERLASIEEKVGSFGRAQREALAAQRHQLDDLGTVLPTRASADTVLSLERRLERVERCWSGPGSQRVRGARTEGVLDEQADGRSPVRAPHRGAASSQPAGDRRAVDRRGRIRADLLDSVRAMGRADVQHSAERLLGGVARRHAGRGTAIWRRAMWTCSSSSRRTSSARRPRRRRSSGGWARSMRSVSSASTDGATASGGRSCCIPGLMYRLFMPFWKDLATIRAGRRSTPAHDAAGGGPTIRWCASFPAEYVAARFYFSECFPDTPANRAFVASTIDGISRQMPVVLLNTPFAVDDHRDVDASGGARAAPSARSMAPAAESRRADGRDRRRARLRRHLRRLFVPGAVLRRARRWRSIRERTFKTHHLQVAQHMSRAARAAPRRRRWTWRQLPVLAPGAARRPGERADEDAVRLGLAGIPAVLRLGHRGTAPRAATTWRSRSTTRAARSRSVSRGCRPTPTACACSGVVPRARRHVGRHRRTACAASWISSATCTRASPARRRCARA